MEIEKYIRGVCTGNIEIRAEIRALYYGMVRTFVEEQNKANGLYLKSLYLYDSILGLINLFFTSKLKLSNFEERFAYYKFNELMSFLLCELYKSEINILKELNLLNKQTIVKEVSFDKKALYKKDFGDILIFREKELVLIRRLMKSQGLKEFTAQYMDLAIDIVHKNRPKKLKISEHEITEYAKDIFSEAVMKLIGLIQSEEYVYEAKLSSFLYYPMLNKWAQIRKELGLEISDELLRKLPDDQRMYHNEQIEQDEMKKYLLDNMKEMNQRESQILWLKEAEGYSYQEIKEKLNLSEEINYLKQLKLRGKRNLEILLKQDKRFKDFFH